MVLILNEVVKYIIKLLINMVACACNLHGQCEAQWNGLYSYEGCQRSCVANDYQDIELTYLVASYDWSAALDWAWSDQQELLRREFRVVFPINQVLDIIEALAYHNFSYLLNYPGGIFTDYVDNWMSDFDYFLIQVETIISLNVFYVNATSLWDEIERSILTTERMTKSDVVNNIATVLMNELDEAPNPQSLIKLKELINGWLPELFRLVNK